MIRSLTIGAAAALLTVLASASLVAEEAEMKPFVMPPLGAPDGAADLRTVFAGPKGEELPAVTVEDGHFAAGGRRVRFWGVNLCFEACFPPHDVADRLAARLAAFGVNCVRFHHMDMHAFPRGIWKKNFSGLEPEALDRLDYLLAALKREGVYANVNLHVSRDFSKTGSRATADELGTFGKMVCLFDPELIELQKTYARDLLGHTNKYTGLRLADDPVVGLVEISNENSVSVVVSRPLAPRYEAMLTRLWNEWLSRRYADDAALAKAWSAGAERRGEEMLKGGDFSGAALETGWRCATIGEAKMSATVENGAAKVSVLKTTDTAWHLQFKQTGLRLKAGQLYTVRLRARADKPRTLDFGVQQDHDPWSMLGLSQHVQVGTEWQTFQASFTAPADESDARLSFSVGQSPGTVWLDDVSLAPGGRDGLRSGESLAGGTVRRGFRDEAVTEARGADFMRFLTETDMAFFGGMRDFLRDELKVRCPITGTEGFTLLSDFAQSHLDFVDSHAYWQHPHFPNRPWDSKDWTIPNTAMVDEPAKSTLVGLAFQRVARPDAASGLRPFTVTEYNHSAPNDYQAECMPMVASFAAAQDWDGVFLFAYSHGGNWSEDYVRSFFDLRANPVKMVQMAAGALLFRRADVAVPQSRVVTYIPPDRLFALAAKHGPWSWALDDVRELAPAPHVRFLAPYSIYLDLAWHQQGLMPSETVPSTKVLGEGEEVGLVSETPPEVWRSAGGGLTWQAKGPKSGIYMARGDRSAAMVGFAAGKPQTVGPVEVSLASPEFAAVTLSSLDGLPLAESKRILITACSRIENTGQTWTADRRSVGNQWGRGPTLVEPVRATVTLARAAGAGGAATLVALDGEGKPAGESAVETAEGGAMRWRLGEGPTTLWYVLEIGSK